MRMIAFVYMVVFFALSMMISNYFFPKYHLFIPHYFMLNSVFIDFTQSLISSAKGLFSTPTNSTSSGIIGKSIFKMNFILLFCMRFHLFLHPAVQCDTGIDHHDQTADQLEPFRKIDDKCIGAGNAVGCAVKIKYRLEIRQ